LVSILNHQFNFICYGPTC